jgi:hypothetical protein
VVAVGESRGLGVRDSTSISANLLSFTMLN